MTTDSRSARAQTQRRLAEVRAREQVGAAGWAQNAALEAIIRAGQEALAASSALEVALERGRDALAVLPLDVGEAERDGHLRGAQALAEQARAQLEAARAVDGQVQAALDTVTRTPLADLSLGRLLALGEDVRREMRVLEAVLDSAQAQAQTLEHLGEWQRVLAQHDARVREIRALGAAREAQTLAETGAQVVQRITELDEAAPQQVEALTRIGGAVVDGVAETAAPPQAQAEALDDLARAARDKAGELRAEVAGGI